MPDSSLNPTIGAAAISAGGSFLSNLIGGTFGSSSINKQIQGQKAINEHSAMLNQKLWQQQQLQGPQLTVQGMRQAGLNPAMIQGQPDIGSIQSPSLGSVTDPSAEYAGIMQSSANAVGNFVYQNGLIDAQKNALNTQATKNLSESTKTDRERFQMEDSWDTVKKNLDVQLKLNTYELTQMNPVKLKQYQQSIADYENKWQQWKLQNSEIIQRIENLKEDKKLTEQNVEYLKRKVDNFRFEIANLISQTSANYASAIASRASANASNAQASLFGQQQKLAFQQTAYVGQQKEREKVQVLQDKFEYEVKKQLGAEHFANIQWLQDYIGVGGEIVSSASRIMDTVTKAKVARNSHKVNQ